LISVLRLPAALSILHGISLVIVFAKSVCCQFSVADTARYLEAELCELK